MDEWRELSLSEAGVDLIDCLHKTPAKQHVGMAYISIPEMRGGELDLASARKISHEDYEEWTKKAKPEACDIVLSRRCNPGETALVRAGMQFALGQNLVLLRSNGEQVHPPFLRWLARSPQWWEQVDTFLNVGAVFDSLRCADVPKFRVLIPPKKLSTFYFPIIAQQWPLNREEVDGQFLRMNKLQSPHSSAPSTTKSNSTARPTRR